MRANEQHYRRVALSHISAFVRQFELKSVLDLGCGTGNAIVRLMEENPAVCFRGIEPVSQLLNMALKKGVSKHLLVTGSGMDLPFKNECFDAVIECGVLHHVPEPQRVVDEMTRCARKAVFLVDSNIFGQGSTSVRVLKLLLYKIRLWELVKFIQTRGRGYVISEGDGLAYSYSIYFQYDRLKNWADKVFAIPVSQRYRSIGAWSPVLAADGVLLCAFRE